MNKHTLHIIFYGIRAKDLIYLIFLLLIFFSTITTTFHQPPWLTYLRQLLLLRILVLRRLPPQTHLLTISIPPTIQELLLHRFSLRMRTIRNGLPNFAIPCKLSRKQVSLMAQYQNQKMTLNYRDGSLQIRWLLDGSVRQLIPRFDQQLLLSLKHKSFENLYASASQSKTTNVYINYKMKSPTANRTANSSRLLWSTY